MNGAGAVARSMNAQDIKKKINAALKETLKIEEREYQNPSAARLSRACGSFRQQTLRRISPRRETRRKKKLFEVT